MRKLKLFFLAVTVISVGAMTMTMSGCSKSNNNNSSNTTDTVYYSSWVTLATTFNTTDSAYEQNITAPAITQSVLDKAVILSYVQYQNYTFVAGDFGIYPAYKVGLINIISGVGNVTGAGVKFRYMIIPGNKAITGTHGGVKIASPADLKNLDYETVTKMYNIPK